MNLGFTEEEYSRVRDWLLSAFEAGPCPFDEATLLANLRSGEWHLLTIENAACVLQLCEYEGDRIAVILLLGGRKNGSLKDIMRASLALCDYLKKMNFAYIVGEPRKEFHAFLKRNGFEQEQKEFRKRLN